MKREWRVIGIDDVSFEKFKSKTTLLIGVVSRLTGRVDGILSSRVKVDGLDATRKIEEMISRSKFRPQIKVIFLGGISFAGLNVVDIKALNEKLGIPVIVIMRKKPNMDRFLKALDHGSKPELRKKIVMKAGEVLRVGKIYVQLAGIDYEKAKKIIKASAIYSEVPEALRLAHLIASGIGLGESRGRV